MLMKKRHLEKAEDLQPNIAARYVLKIGYIKKGNTMTDKELKRLRRGELLELLLEQSKENEFLKKQVKELSEDVEDLRKKLTDKRLELDKAGTIAEAAFKLNGVYSAAEAAAKQYLDNLELLYIREEEKTVKKIAEAEAYVQKLLEDTNEKCNALEEKTENQCAAMKQSVQERCQAMRDEAQQECDRMMQETKEKCETLETETRIKCEDTNAKCSALERKTENQCAAIKQSVQERCQAMRDETQQECDRMMQETKEKCGALETETRMKCEERELTLEARCRQREMKAEETVEKRWDELTQRLEAFYSAHIGLREILSGASEVQRE